MCVHHVPYWNYCIACIVLIIQLLSDLRFKAKQKIKIRKQAKIIFKKDFLWLKEECVLTFSSTFAPQLPFVCYLLLINFLKL